MDGDYTARSSAACFMFTSEKAVHTRRTCEIGPDVANDSTADSHAEDNTQGNNAYSAAAVVDSNGASSVLFESAKSHHSLPHFVHQVDPYPHHDGRAGGLSDRTTYVRWTYPAQPVRFRDWYTYHYCNEAVVNRMLRIQQTCSPLKPYLTRYFQAWSWTGEAEFYIVMLPTLVWIGQPEMAVHVASMLCLNLYLTGVIKDMNCCPRPPCPPLELRGDKVTHEMEYGFPSTHSCHAVVFAYFIYNELTILAPQHAWANFLLGAVFAVSISLSRVYLAMHWPGDLVGGWLVAVACTIVHSAFLSSWESFLVLYRYPPWWAYVLVYVVVHFLAVVHAAPRDPCPCYIDSMRFTGAFAGSIVGLWLYNRFYDDAAQARTSKASFLEVYLTWRFALAWVFCIAVVLASREVTAWVCGKALRPVFMFCSGAHKSKLPRVLQRPYMMLAWLIGLTTSGNERSSRRRRELASVSDALARMHRRKREEQQQQQQQHYRQAATAEGKAMGEVDEMGSERISMMRSLVAAEDDPYLKGGDAKDRSRGELDDDKYAVEHDAKTNGSLRSSTVAHARLDRSDVAQATTLAQTPTLDASMAEYHKASPQARSDDEVDGYLTHSQLWSLRTHGHWWLWDVHRRTCAYFVTGFTCTFIAPIILRKIFRFGQ